jgi:hypothetical protein
MLIASRYEELLLPKVIFFLYGLLNVVYVIYDIINKLSNTTKFVI